ncbi:MAG: hypothetical protein GF418_04855 [Chitinivibrionales bacterium]|nr:hypothetical protein [Chitinivibrionales bacterium]MBD3394938.1 hypothetical protein [Chitinivibrionales bacterium]
MKLLLAVLAPVLGGLIIGCSTGSDIAGVPGSGSETTNGFTASVVYPGGAPAAGATVTMRPSGYLAESGGLAKSRVYSYDAQTDENGVFSIDSVDTGQYYIEVNDGQGNAVVFYEGFTAGDTVVDLRCDTLVAIAKLAGTVTFTDDMTSGAVRVFGLERYQPIAGDGYFSVDVPAGLAYTLRISTDNAETNVKLDSILNPSQLKDMSYDYKGYRADSALVQAFLDSMGVAGAAWLDVIGVEGGRIVELTLDGMGITSLHPSIAACTSLSELWLDDNPLTDLPLELAALPNLEGISLCGVELTALPTVVPSLAGLTFLDLSYTGLDTLPPELANLALLEELSLGGNDLGTVPAVVLTMSQLLSLDLSDNSLTSLPAGISAMVSLEELDVSYNRLSSLPPGIGQLVNLVALGAERNLLDSLPATIGLLTGIESLNLESNRLAALPEEIGQLLELGTLLLGDNPLAGLPQSIIELEPVEELGVEGARLCNLPLRIEEWVEEYAGEDWRVEQPQSGCGQ